MMSAYACSMAWSCWRRCWRCGGIWPARGFAHLHPSGPVHGDRGGPVLRFHAVLPESGRYRLFVQFRVGGTLRTAQVTLPVS